MNEGNPFWIVRIFIKKQIFENIQGYNNRSDDED